MYILVNNILLVEQNNTNRGGQGNSYLICFSFVFREAVSMSVMEKETRKEKKGEMIDIDFGDKFGENGERNTK